MRSPTGLAETSPAAPARRAVRVAELVARLQVGLSENFPNRFWVEGEISGFKVARSGHAFFALKESNAQIEAVIWRDRLARLPVSPEEGGQVLALVRKVDFYAPSGRLRLHVDAIEPRGIGALAKALEERKARLDAEGLFAPERKRPLPFLPRVIGIATAGRSAALRDILEILQQRFSQRRLILRLCRVQGKGAASDIAAALDELNRHGEAEVIILGRGGGSMEDLWCFNEEEVVRAVARSRIPVISGIGHEVDWTLADHVADFRAATPTAAAQRCLPEHRDLQRRLVVFGERLQSAVDKRVELARVRFAGQVAALGDPRELVRRRSARLDALASRAREVFSRLTPERRLRLERAQGILRANLPRTDVSSTALKQLGRRLDVAMGAGLKRARERLAARSSEVHALSPLSVLGRGFSVTQREQGEIVRDAMGLAVDEEVRLRFARGTARARILETEPGENALDTSEGKEAEEES